MKYFLIALTTLISIQTLCAQNAPINKALDSLYREDQFYFSITYNILNNKSQDISQNGFSGGFHLGFIRDFPINEQRNMAFGIGLGLSANSFNQNLKISESNGTFNYEVLSGGFDKNRFNFYQVELPIQFRWRTSTAEIYNFWRIYTGLKLGYVFSSKAKFVDSEGSYNTPIVDVVNRLQYGLTVSAGYDSWNLHLYYGLNTIFKDQRLNDQPIDLATIKAGLIFYFL
jgi:hypothetical protein